MSYISGIYVPMDMRTDTHDQSMSASKYALVVIKAREVLALQSSGQRGLLNVAVDSYLVFLMQNFEPIPSTEEVRHALQRRTDVLNENELRKVPDGIVPLTVVRTLMRDHRVNISPRSLKHWKTFSDRYRDQVLQA